jgi:glutathione S-transferase
VTVTLWHIPISHYSEKVRWALDFKGVEHDRHAPFPPGHMVAAYVLTRGSQKTLPVLSLDGERIGDSTAIIAELERRHPEPPLYPADPEERQRALALEDWFDEELGPHIRLLAWHEITNQPDSLGAISLQQAPPPLKRFARAIGPGLRMFVNLRYGVHHADRAALARERVVAALDRLEAELGDRHYLVGDGFTVADLTAAALFYPLVLPPEGPDVPPPPAALEAYRAPLKERPGYGWVEQIFRRHRRRRLP